MNESNSQGAGKIAYGKRLDIIIAAVVTLVLFTVIGICYDMVYYLNDDVMIQSILSGRFSGTASGMAVYFNQPLSSLLAFLYNVIPDIPWFGVLLEGCYVLCFFLVLYFSLIRFSEFAGTSGKITSKFFLCILCAAVFYGFFLGQYLMPHYTVASAVVGGTALYLLLISKESREWKETIRLTWPSVVLLLFCYLIRTNVFFMVLPFLAAAGIYRMVKTKSIVNYLPPLFLLAGGVLIFMLIGRLSYKDVSWREYLVFNDVRTTLYDYVGVWEDDTAMKYYAEQGYQPEEISVYKEYNILLNENLTTEDLEILAAYGSLMPDRNNTIVQRLKDGFWLYRNRELTAAEDIVYSHMILIIYLLAVVLMVAGKDGKSLFLLALLGCARSFVWIYILGGGRYPERITNSLYLVELLVLLAILVNTMELLAVSGINRGTGTGDNTKQTPMEKKAFLFMKQVGVFIANFILFILSIEAINGILPDALERSRQQITINEEEDKLYDYMKSHPANLYFIDVYAVVRHTEYVFKDYDKTYENYMTLGGWVAGSPLVADKLADWGYESAYEALMEGENVCLVFKDDIGMTIEDWLAYCALRNGGDNDFSQIEVIETGRGNYRIYQRTPGL